MDVHPWGQKLYDMAQSVGSRMGMFASHKGKAANEIVVRVESDTMPNAYVYALDYENPRVHFYTPLVEFCWDHERSDWVTVTVDAEGNRVRPGTPGARTLEVGRLVLESVMAHELGHIRDDAMYYDSMYGLLINYAYDRKEIYADLGPGKQKLFDQAERFLSDPAVKGRNGALPAGKLPLSTLDKLQPKAAELFKKAGLTPEGARALLKRIRPSAHNSDVANKLKDPQSSEFGELAGYWLDAYQLSRAMEITADRWAFVLQGTNVPTAAIDMVFGTNANVSEFDDTAQKQAVLHKNWERWDEYSQTMLEQFAKAGDPGMGRMYDLLFCVSHPPSAVRIQLGANYMSDPTMEANRVKALRDETDLTKRYVDTIATYQRVVNTIMTKVDQQAHTKTDATARVMRNAPYMIRAREWRGYAVTLVASSAEVMPDSAFLDKEGEAYKNMVKLIKETETPMVMLLEGLKRRVDKLFTQDRELQEVLDTRKMDISDLLKNAREEQVKLYKARKLTDDDQKKAAEIRGGLSR